MWLSILAAAGVAVLEYFTLQTYRSFRQLPAAAKAYHFRVLWLSSAPWSAWRPFARIAVDKIASCGNQCLACKKLYDLVRYTCYFQRLNKRNPAYK